MKRSAFMATDTDAPDAKPKLGADSGGRSAHEEELIMVGRVVASLIHEFRNPLAVIETSLLLIERRSLRGQSVDRHVGRARSQIDRSRRMVDELLEVLRDRPVTRRRVVSSCAGGDSEPDLPKDEPEA